MDQHTFLFSDETYDRALLKPYFRPPLHDPPRIRAPPCFASWYVGTENRTLVLTNVAPIIMFLLTFSFMWLLRAFYLLAIPL